jgi:hypothetical protein
MTHLPNIMLMLFLQWFTSVHVGMKQAQLLPCTSTCRAQQHQVGCRRCQHLTALSITPPAIRCSKSLQQLVPLEFFIYVARVLELCRCCSCPAGCRLCQQLC